MTLTPGRGFRQGADCRRHPVELQAWPRAHWTAGPGLRKTLAKPETKICFEIVIFKIYFAILRDIRVETLQNLVVKCDFISLIPNLMNSFNQHKL